MLILLSVCEGMCMRNHSKKKPFPPPKTLGGEGCLHGHVMNEKFPTECYIELKQRNQFDHPLFALPQIRLFCHVYQLLLFDDKQQNCVVLNLQCMMW